MKSRGSRSKGNADPWSVVGARPTAASHTISVPGIVRGSADRVWIDLDDAALTELGLNAGDKVMVHCADGDVLPGVLVHDGRIYAVKLECAPSTERVYVRPRTR